MKTEFHSFEICKLLDIKIDRLKDWMTRGYITPSVRRACGQGTKNVFTLHDVLKIEIFSILISAGFSRQLSSAIIEKGGLMESDILKKLDHAIDKLNNMSEAAVNRSRWKPIASAPRDGTNILGFKNGIMATVRWLSAEQYWTLCVPGTFTLYHDWDPQLWMPLPPPP